MANHLFIFSPGYWLGDGKISFSASKEQIGFATRWIVEEEDDNAVISCTQEVEMRGSNEKVLNKLKFSQITEKNFRVELENDLAGKVKGKGVIDSKTIAWELREHAGFEGFEVYEIQENGEYHFHAEYASSENFRTIIDGRIWRKGS